MGRAAQDGTFAEFQAKVTALPIGFAGAAVQMQNLRGQQIQFGWTGNLIVNGSVEPISGFKHYDSPWTGGFNAEQMDIQFFDQGMRLNFI